MAAEVCGRGFVVAGGGRDVAARVDESSAVSSRQRSPASLRRAGCLVEAGEHAQQRARLSSGRGCGFSGRSASRVRSASSAGRGPRASASSRRKSHASCAAGEAGVAERLLRRLRKVLEAAADVREPEPSAYQTCTRPAWSSACSSNGSAFRASRSSSSTAGSAAKNHAMVNGTDVGEQLRLFLRRPRAPARRRRRRSRPPARRPDERASARSSSRDVEPHRPGQLERPLEQASGGAASPARARGGRRPRAARRRARPGSGRLGRARAGSGRPARGGSRGSRPTRPDRAPRCSSQPAKRSCSSARVAFGSAS